MLAMGDHHRPLPDTRVTLYENSDGSVAVLGLQLPTGGKQHQTFGDLYSLFLVDFLQLGLLPAMMCPQVENDTRHLVIYIVGSWWISCKWVCCQL